MSSTPSRSREAETSTNSNGVVQQDDQWTKIPSGIEEFERKKAADDVLVEDIMADLRKVVGTLGSDAWMYDNTGPRINIKHLL
mmetsp:Transcript_47826/g.96324  ORF Transcript_47826/g.96324 Transcript_47826/m.96324 type:complete len:83 (-) Transcript_47826:345-593(-)